MLVFNIIIFLVSLFLLYRGAEYVVDYSSKMAAMFGVTPIVIALTIVAFGTSAPELVASIAAILQGKPDLVIGNNIGSNIANIGLILGAGAAFRTIKVRSRTLKQEIPFFTAAAILLFIVSLDGTISREEGGFFVLAAVIFTLFLIIQARKERVFDEAVAQVKAHLEPRHPLINIVMVTFGLILLVLGAKFLVSSAVFLALMFGVSESVIGITIVAIGTSLPELVTALVASFKRDNELVVGNVIGSNILNIFLILGITAMLIPIAVNAEAIFIDIPIMLLFTFGVIILMRTKYEVSRTEGFILMTSYFLYILYVVGRP